MEADALSLESRFTVVSHVSREQTSGDYETNHSARERRVGEYFVESEVSGDGLYMVC